MRVLLAAVCLLVGTNAWADTETFGASKATGNSDEVINGTAVNIASSSNPKGTGQYAVFNSKTDKGLKLRTGSALTLNVNDGYKITNVTVYAYQNNTESKTITCDSYTIDGGTPTAFGTPISVPLNVDNASSQTLATISTGDITAKTSIEFNFTNTGAGQNQIYAFIEVTYESPFLYGTLVHTASSNSDADNTFSSSVDASTEKYMNEAGTSNKGFAFAEFSYAIPTGKYVKSATLIWSATNITTGGARTSKVYYLNAGKTIDYDALKDTPSELRYHTEKTWIKDVVTAKGISAVSDRTDVTSAVAAMAGQGFVIFQWTGNAGGANLNGKGAAEGSRPKLLIEIEDLPFAEADYYFKNKDTNGYLAVGQNWSTQAITNHQGHRMGLVSQPDGSYHINSYIYFGEDTGSDRHYLNDNFNDGASQNWTLVDAGEGYYTLTNANGNLTASTINAACSMTSGTGDNTKWQIMTEAEWKADQEARLATATSVSGEDATFYIAAPDFNWADMDERAKWQGEPSVAGWDNKGSGRFLVAEKFNTTPFDVYQNLTGVKPGLYKVTCDGFYRNGTTNDRKALLYANSFETPLVNIRSAGITAQDNDKGFTTDNDGYYVPNMRDQAAKAFYNGYYNNELYFVVGEDGNLRIGVKKTPGAASDWACFDNFQLTYYGTTIPATIASSTGYATFSSPYAVDFREEAGLTVYKAKVNDGKSAVVLTAIDSKKVPANTGVILAGSAATYTGKGVASAAAVTENDLLASTNRPAEINDYILVEKDSKAVFAPMTSGILATGKAYLPAAKCPTPASAKSLTIVFDDETLGISDATLRNGNAEGMGEKTIYNLSGQRIAAPQKGINIVNGKKIIVK